MSRASSHFSRCSASSGTPVLARRAAWPSDDNFDKAGEIQGGLLGSEDFRALTEKLLGKS